MEANSQENKSVKTEITQEDKLKIDTPLSLSVDDLITEKEIEEVKLEEIHEEEEKKLKTCKYCKTILVIWGNFWICPKCKKGFTE